MRQRLPRRLPRPGDNLRAALRFAVFALFVCVVLAPREAAALAANGDTVKVDTSAGYARLLFTLSAPGAVNAAIEDGVLTIRPPRPIAVTAEALADQLGPYVSSSRRDADGTYRFALDNPARLHQTAQGNLAAVDVVPASFNGDPPNLPPPPPPPKPEPLDVSKLPVIPVRVGEHSNFTRLVFDWPSNVTYTTFPGQGRITIRFDSPAQPDLSALESRSPAWVKSAGWRLDDKTLVVDFDTDPQAGFTHSRDGNRVIIDVLAPKTDAAGLNLPAIAPVTPPTAAAPAAAHETPPAAPKPPAPKPPQAASTPAPPVSAGALLAGGTVAASGDGKQAVAAPPRAELSRAGVILHFPAARGLPVAVFSRGPTIWIVLDEHPALDPVNLLAGIGALIEKAETSQVAGSAVLRLVLKNPLVAVVQETEASLDISLAATSGTPPQPIVLTRQGANGISTLTAPLPGARHGIALADPVVGDHILVVPAYIGRGMLTTKRFPELETLTSTAGLAIIPHTDDLTVRVQAEIATFGRPTGLSLSDTNLDPKPQVLPPKTGESAAFVDFAGWSHSDAPDMFSAIRDLRIAAAKVPEANANKSRLRFAQYLLANGLAAEALGELRVMTGTDPKLATDLGVLTMMGAAQYMMGRYADADRTLSGSMMDGDVHAALWRGLAKAKLNEWANARRNFQIAQPVLRKYPTEWQARTYLAHAEAGLAMSNIATAVDMLDQLPRQLDARDAGEARFLKARVMAAQRYYNQATAEFATLANSDYPPLAARATFALVDLQLTTKKIKPAAAAEALEKLRYRWRGDELEQQTLRKLGSLYFGEKKWREGLETLRVATTAFPGTDLSRSAQDDMRGAFADLFLGGKADSLPPVQALSLFYDFAELTPIGRDGDEMIRQLSDRLVTMDLLGPAEELLLHQVNERLEGVARGVVATKLAAIYLLDQKPRDALQILSDTRQTGLPDELVGQRRFLEARALVGLKQFDNAIDLIAEDDTPEARSLRVDIYWQSGNWARAGATAEEFLAERWQAEGDLSAPDQAQVLRAAIAYALGGDQASLARLRERYGAKMAKGAESKAFAAVTESSDFDGLALRDMAKRVASLDTLQPFMDELKARAAAKVASN